MSIFVSERAVPRSSSFLSESSRWVDLPVWVIAGLALLAGVLQSKATRPPSREISALSGTAHVTLPAGWIVNENDSDSFVTHPPTLGDFPPTVSMARLTAPKEGVTPVFIDLESARMEEERASSGLGYRVLETKQKRAFGGLRSEWTYYALVRDPPGVRQS